MHRKSLKYIYPFVLGSVISLHAQEEGAYIQPAQDTITADNTFHTDLGIQEYILGDITITGDVNYNELTILTFSGLQTGQKITLPGDELSDAIKKLWSLGYFSDIKFYETRREGNVIDLEIYLNQLPRLNNVRITNLKKTREQDLIKEMELDKRPKIVNENLIANTRNYIINKYRKTGFYNTTVDIKVKPTAEKKEADLIITFDKGKKVRISEINIEGNQLMTDGKLKRAMKKTKQKSPLNPYRLLKPSKFIATEYKTDLNNIIDEYKKNGFRDARIVEEKTTYNAKDNTMKIDIQLEEGRKYYVGNIRFIGNTVYPDHFLRNILATEKGEVYNGIELNKRIQDPTNPDSRDITNLYQNNGYLFSRVNLVETKTYNDTIDFDVRIYEGTVARLNNITVKGNDKTHDYIILRELSTIPGQKWDRSNIYESMRRLQSMNIFDAQNIVPDVKNVDQVDSTVDIEWNVVEQGQSQVEVQGGYGGRTFIGTVALSFNNFSLKNIFNKNAYKPFPMGDAQKLSLRAQASTYFQTYSLSFQEPWFGGRKPISLFGSISHSRQFAYNSYSYDIDRSQGLNITSISLGVAKRLSDPFFTLSQSISYQNYNLSNYNTSYFAFKDGTSKNLAYTLELTRDNRGGLHPAIFPSTGSVMSISGKFTFPYSLVNNVDYKNLANQEEYKIKTTELMTHPITGADIPVGSYLNENGIPVADYRDAAVDEERLNQKRFNWLEYYKINVKADWYTTIVEKLVLRTTGQFGFLGAYNQDRGAIPFERFFLGGSGMMNFSLDGRENVALRGYEDNGLNQKDEYYNPIGGTVYNKFSLELRYPISLKAQMSAYVLGFYDAGAVYQDFKSYNPFKLQRSAGAGVRVFMPMFGLLGIDFGYGFDKVPGTNQKGGWQTHFILGQQF